MALDSDESLSPTDAQDNDKTKLEIEKTKREAEKIELEIADLRYQARRYPRLMRIFGPALTAILSLIVSTTALVISSTTQKSQGALEHSVKEHEALRNDIDIATDNSKGRERQVAGIWNLQRYLDTDDKYPVAFTLVALLANHDKFIRTAAADAIVTAIRSLGSDGSSDSRRKELIELFFGKNTGGSSMGIVAYQNSIIRQLMESDEAEVKSKGQLGENTEEKIQSQRVNRDNQEGTKEAILKCSTFLSQADFRGCDLTNIDLSGANFKECDLSNTNLSDANLKDADLSGANLRGATFSRANLTGGDLRNVRNDDSTVFREANIYNVQADDSFKELAFKREAVEMDETTWNRWKNAGWPRPKGESSIDSNPDEAWVRWRDNKFKVDDNGTPILGE